MQRTRISENPRPRKKQRQALVAIETCGICDDHIYDHNMYSMFVDGYAHDDCINFLRIQARLMRSIDD